MDWLQKAHAECRGSQAGAPDARMLRSCSVERMAPGYALPREMMP